MKLSGAHNANKHYKYFYLRCTYVLYDFPVNGMLKPQIGFSETIIHLLLLIVLLTIEKMKPLNNKTIQEK